MKTVVIQIGQQRLSQPVGKKHKRLRKRNVNVGERGKCCESEKRFHTSRI